MKPVLLFVLVLVASFKCQQTNDTRCSIYDSKCQQIFFQSVATRYASTGIPNAGIKVIDPFKLINVVLSILGLLTLTLLDGEAVGIGQCIVTKFESNVEGRYREVELICDKITIQGYYKLTSSPIMGNVCGWCNLHGQGNGTIVLEDWFFKFKYPFRIVRREDGKIYLDAIFDKSVYEATVKKVTVGADSIMSGKHDITHKIISFINNNWKRIMDSCIGKFINDESAKYYYDIYDLFYKTSSADTFLKDDFTTLLESK